MTFSELAKVLYPYCSKGDNTAEFVIRLTDKIMGGRPGRPHQDGGYKNPLRTKELRTLQYFFSGDRTIPSNDASIILSAIDKKKFKEFLEYQCSDGALEMLSEDLSTYGLNTSKYYVAEVCANQFATILHELAIKVRK